MTTCAVSNLILKNINDFIQGSVLKETIPNLKKPDEKIIILNNSFIFREATLKTNKNDKYLAFIPGQGKVDETNCFVITGTELKSDSQIKDINDKNIVRHKLTETVQQQLTDIGNLVFIMIGRIDNNVVIESALNHTRFKKIILKPSITSIITIDGDDILCQNTDDEEDIWNAIEAELKKNHIPDDEIFSLQESIGHNFTELKTLAYSKIIIPDAAIQNHSCFLDTIVSAIKENLKEYENALNDLNTSGEKRKTALMETLRIAYNFTDDAVTLIRLIMSICDLKPIVLWGTFYDHYCLNESIKNLPWTKQKTKPKLSEYTSTVKKARNKAFHRLLPFSKAFEVELPDKTLKDAKLRIFSEYKKGANQLQYKDKELVDVLMEFTRTSDETVSDEFWRKNAEVIRNTLQLLENTADVLKIILKDKKI